MKHGLLVQKVGRHNVFNDMLSQILSNLFIGHIGIVLGGDEDGVYSHGDQVTLLHLIFDSHLHLGVGSHPRDDLLESTSIQSIRKLICQLMRKRHKFLSLI